MKVNRNKDHLLIPGYKEAIANIDNNCIMSEDLHGLLGITINSKLIFETHINKLYKKASQKLNALAQVFNYMAFDKKKMIMKAFITSQFSYEQISR